MNHKKIYPRVFIGLLEISGYYAQLEQGFNKIGVPAQFVTVHPHPFDFDRASQNPTFARFAERAVLRHRSAGGLAKPLWALLFALNVFLLFVWSLFRFDVYIFAWGESFFPKNVDLPLLKLFGKRVVVNIGHGSEARPPYMSRLSSDQSADLKGYTDRVFKKVRRIERRAHTVIGLPTTAQFLSKPFIDFYSLGLPADNISQSPVAAKKASKTVSIVHIPSKPEIKGTAEIRAVMAKLSKKYPQVSYREVTGVPHREVLQILSECDFVIDQLWSDIPMAVIGMEAAGLGKASVISGYAWDYWDGVSKKAVLPPSIRTTPEGLEKQIDWCIHNPDKVHQVGVQANEFLSTEWAAVKVAQRYMQVLTHQVPHSWLVDPASLSYAWGCGVPQEVVSEQVDSLVSQGGWPSLHWSRAESIYGERA